MASGFALVTRWLPRTSVSALRNSSRRMLSVLKILPMPVVAGSSNMASAKCSTLTYSSLSLFASSWALTRSLFNR